METVAIPVTDPRERIRRYRKTAKGRVVRQNEQRAYRDRKWLSREFVAWDGEGVTRDDGSHDYLLLANSTGALIRSHNHLSTKRILDFALDHSRPDTTNVIYGASYDWNMWLKDLPQDILTILYKRGAVKWEGYLLKWRPGKTFDIRKDKRSVRFYDVVSFFQCPFVKACDDYLGDDFVDRELIVENKMLRSGFRPDDLDEITRYNHAELTNLVHLMNELRQRLYNGGLKPSRWDGPGAIAVCMLQQHRVKDHLRQEPEHFIPPVRYAYFGGRFEVVKNGHVSAPAYEYDINSAYPWALLDVPSLNGGTWEYVEGDPGHRPYAIYNLDYRGETAPTFPQPLPCRFPDGAVAFPQNVEGWYWSPEYLSTKAYVKRWGGSLVVKGAYVFRPISEHKPFAFVEGMFNKRRALKLAGDGAHVGYKLGLNSMYGKCAQQVGWRVDRKGNVKLPPYHQLDWAGYVTSKCRASVLMAALDKLGSVIAWETDAMFTTEPLDVKEGDRLGEWDYLEFTSLTYLQSGTYFGTTVDGKDISRTRGVDRGTLTRDDVLDAMRNGRSHVSASLTRFTTLGAALQGRFDHWARWETVPKEISLIPNGKRFHIPCHACNSKGFAMGNWHPTIIALWAQGQNVSSEYEIEWINPGKMSEALSLMREEHYNGGKYDDA